MRTSFLALALLCLSSVPTLAQWSVTNTPVVTQIDDQREVRLASDNLGGAFLSWVDLRVDGQNGDIYAQRLDAAGVRQWAAGGLGICTTPADQGAVAMTEDGSGATILVWNDWRSGNRDIYAQKVMANGTVAWTANGIAVVAKALDQQDAKLVSDGSGGALVVWQDSTAAGFDVYAQRINAAGVPQWAAAGVPVCTALGDQVNPRLEVDGAGGAIITWQDRRSGSSYDIYAQRLNASGAAQWTANGIVIANAASTQSNPKIEPDGAGGAYICWQDKRVGNFDVYAQRINGAGQLQWLANGVAMCTDPGSQSAIDMTTGAGLDGVILAWKDDRSGSSAIYARQINSAGVPQWAANGVMVSNGAGPSLKPNVVGDGAGAANIVWQDSSAGNWNIVSAKVDAAGTVQWRTIISSSAGDQTDPKNLPDGTGGCIYAWQDLRNTQDLDVYAHHLFGNGALTEVPEAISGAGISISPNPFSYLATLTTTFRMEDACLSVWNACGQLVLQRAHLSGQSIQLDAHDGLGEGVFLFSIGEGDATLGKGKFVILR